jgi:hypothetical protein
MFGLSALSSILSESKKFARGMMTAGAAMVVIFGLAMFGNGMSLSGLPGMADSASAAVQGGPSFQGALARIEGDVQLVRTELASGRYAPITVQTGVPVRWTIHAEPGTLNGCNNRIVIPEFGRMQKKLELGDNVVEFTPTKSGAFLYTCWMGMIRGRITVVDKIGDAEGVRIAETAAANEDALAAELPPDLYPDFSDGTDASDPFDDFPAFFGDAENNTAEEPRRAQTGCLCCSQ